jgi:arabinogalactan oligomer / maltooligosaccharide transport system substrate-binding protein
MRPKRLTVMLCALFVLFAVPLLSGCGTSSAGSGTVHLTYWYTEGTNEAPAIKTLIDKFNADNANIKVDATYVAFDGAHDKYVQAAQTGTAPDVLRSDVGWNSEFASKGLLYDITSMQGDTSDFLKAPLAYCTWQGKLYGLPQVTDFLVLYYNKSALSAKNVSVPTTMQDFDAANKALTGGGKFGWEFQGGSYFAQAFIFAFGGGLIDDSGKPLINNAGSINGLNFLKQELQYAPKLDFANGYANTMTDFKAGKAAMIVNGPWEYTNILSGDAFKANASNLGIAAVPYDSATGDVARSPAGGQNYVMYKGTKHPTEALKFMQFMSSAASQGAIAKANSTLPTRHSAYDTADVKGTASVAAFAALLPSQKARPVTKVGGNIYAPASGFDPNLQKFLTGAEDATTAANNIADGFQKLLNG